MSADDGPPGLQGRMAGPPVRNDLPEFVPYVYRGTGRDEIRAAEVREAAEARRLARAQRKADTETRQRRDRATLKARLEVAFQDGRVSTPRQARLLSDERCEDCGYLLESPGHEASCLS